MLNLMSNSIKKGKIIKNNSKKIANIKKRYHIKVVSKN